jgi:hypothetical protein
MFANVMSIRSNTTGVIPHKPPFAFLQIQIMWEDGMTRGVKYFNDVHELANFLKANPAFAEGLKYVAKKT